MAKVLSEKSRIVRVAITANPDKSNKELAELLNDSADRLDDKLTFTGQDVANQKLAMKKPGAVKVDSAAGEPGAAAAAPATGNKRGRKKGGRKVGRKPKVAANAAPAKPASAPMELLGKVFDLAEEVGGFGELKTLVDRLAGMER
jgi:hypothetical protein